jgi:quinol monooxygenase YgiN
MLIAVLDLRTTAADRAVALAQLDGERDEIRAMPGNLDFRVYAARDDAEAVAVIHEWRTSRRSPTTSHLMRSPARARCSARW